MWKLTTRGLQSIHPKSWRLTRYRPKIHNSSSPKWFRDVFGLLPSVLATRVSDHRKPARAVSSVDIEATVSTAAETYLKNWKRAGCWKKIHSNKLVLIRNRCLSNMQKIQRLIPCVSYFMKLTLKNYFNLFQIPRLNGQLMSSIRKPISQTTQPNKQH